MRLSAMLPVEYKLTIFNAFIVTNFLYCHAVWHMCSKSDTEKVERYKREHYVSYIENSKVIINLY